jgi:DNA mismatch repair protein MutS
MENPTTPMAKQYQEIKSRYKDAILFYRLGDFYEMFNDDALVASKELDLTLTGRGSGDGRMPMCGIPYHAASNYISKLLSKGHKVAICEQIEDPKTAKGVVKRDVIKVITPGTVQEEMMLEQRSSNYLLAVSFQNKNIGISYMDASTGEFKVTRFSGEDCKGELIDEIERVSPAEILMPDMVPDENKDIFIELKNQGYLITIYKDTYDIDIAEKKVLEHFKVRSLDSFGLKGYEETFGAAAAILDYLVETQKGSLKYVKAIQPYETGGFLYIDQSTRRNLELVSSIRERSIKGTLLSIMDETSTPMGGRLLKKWILQPQTDIDEINSRLDAVEDLCKDLLSREQLKGKLKMVSDIERLIGRAAAGISNARDLVALKESLKRLPEIKIATNKFRSKKLAAVKDINEQKEVISLLERSIKDDPSPLLKEGGLIKDGYDKELDEIRGLAHGGKKWIAELELQERNRTGIKSLKVGYTSVFGYFIEVSNSNVSSVPADYIRKQTLVNCERYITPELKEKETTILNAQEKMFSKEYEIFSKVREEISKYTKELQSVSDVLSELDVLTSFSSVAAQNKYVRPVLGEKNIEVIEGRHPVVEKTLGPNKYTPNDVMMDKEESRFLLITGPNMAGKSTFMRQVALISIMAQMGSFVPAKSAKLPIFDRIFTRIGAMDDIFSGQSTFMVEMTETSNILNNATENSLVILDEIGRGTSTFDGMSIAAAVSEFIHEKIKAYTLFATHYHEITQLADKHKSIKNYNTLVKKEGDSVIFLHKIVEGAADQSYGIEVAKLAGLPNDVITRAKEIYNTLEMVEKDVASLKTNKKSPNKDQIGLF